MARISVLVLLAMILAACVPAGPGIPPTSATTYSGAGNVSTARASIPRSRLGPTTAGNGRRRNHDPSGIWQRPDIAAGARHPTYGWACGRGRGVDHLRRRARSLPNGRHQQVEAEAISRLLRQITESGFFDFGDATSSLSKCRDCFNYQITVSKDGQTKDNPGAARIEQYPAGTAEGDREYRYLSQCSPEGIALASASPSIRNTDAHRAITLWASFHLICQPTLSDTQPYWPADANFDLTTLAVSRCSASC